MTDDRKPDRRKWIREDKTDEWFIQEIKTKSSNNDRATILRTARRNHGAGL